MTDIPIPPSPRRCRRIIEAHHLHCQALTQHQIADRMGCARPTVSAYLRDFQLHRDHILHAVAGDQLLDQVYQLTQPDAEPEGRRQRIAAARELRLLLRDLPQLQQHEQQRREQLEAARNAPAILLARSRHFLAEADGHVRYAGGFQVGQCLPECPRCRPELYEGDDALPPVTVDDSTAYPRTTRTDPVQPDPTSADDFYPEPDEIEQDLTKSDIPETESPAHSDEFADQVVPTPQSPPVPRKVGPQHPFNFNTNPSGYLPSNAITIRYNPLTGFTPSPRGRGPSPREEARVRARARALTPTPHRRSLPRTRCGGLG